MILSSKSNLFASLKFKVLVSFTISGIMVNRTCTQLLISGGNLVKQNTYYGVDFNSWTRAKFRYCNKMLEEEEEEEGYQIEKGSSSPATSSVVAFGGRPPIHGSANEIFICRCN